MKRQFKRDDIFAMKRLGVKGRQKRMRENAKRKLEKWKEQEKMRRDVDDERMQERRTAEKATILRFGRRTRKRDKR